MTATKLETTPRPEFWADRTMTASAARRLMAELDPVEHCAEITHISLEVLVPPIAAHAAYASGTARGMIHPAEAKVGYREGKGDQLQRPQHRDRDTLTFFGLMMREGFNSPMAQAIFDRVQQIHHDVRGVSNQLQLHILCLLIVEAERWISDIGFPDWFSEKENEARLHFWRGVGEGMGLTDIPETYADAKAWAESFEAEHFKVSAEANVLYRGQVKGFERWFPTGLKSLAYPMLTAGLSDMTRNAVQAQTGESGRRAWDAGIRAWRASESVRHVNLSTTWITSFSRPDYFGDIDKLGYQHDMANDPRYQRAGDPADGYRFTVAGGIESASS